MNDAAAKPPIKKPALHLNGTDGETLFRQHADAAAALRAAITALQAAAPHGRDYYPQGDTVLIEAGREHRDRIARIRSVLAEVEELCEHVADERDSAENRREVARARRRG
jgi:hypothetical protein